MYMDQHLGIVMANTTDQEKRGGIQVRADTLLADFEYPDLFYPIFPPNTFKVPEVGEIVEVIVIGDIDISDPSDDNELGVLEYSDYCFYTGRVFDLADGKIPADLKKNYPKRSGLFWNIDGTMIYYDATKKQKELMVNLTDKQTFIMLKEDEVLFQHKTVKIQMKSGKVIITDSATEMGAAGANEPIPLGNKLITYLTSVVSTFGTTHTHICAAPGIASGPPVPTMPTVPSDLLSTKHKVDQ